MTSVLVAIFPGLFVGLMLGLTGGGGSLFAVPILIYIFGLSHSEAASVSLLVVGFAALIGAMSAFRRGLLSIKPTFLFAVGGVFAAPVGLEIGERTPDHIRSLLFAMLAIALAIRMFFRPTGGVRSRATRDGLSQKDYEDCRRELLDDEKQFLPVEYFLLLLSGLSVGALSGFFGVGGGFLIVPALMLVTSIDMSRAVGSSLAVIAMIGITGGSQSGVELLIGNFNCLLFGFGCLGGMALGRTMSDMVSGRFIQRLFSSMLLGVGFFLLIENGLRLI